MRNRSMGTTLVLLAFPAVLFAQGRAAGAETATPDLSGVWSLHTTPATRYMLYGFTKEDPPMTPWAMERFKLTKPSFGPRMVEDSNDPVNPTTVNAAGCFPPGVPRIYLHPFPLEIINTPGRVIMLFEFDHFIRQIFTDGRPHNNATTGPTWMGDSTGVWQGDTLVVDTIGFNDKTWLDRGGHPHSEAMHLVERFRRLDHDTLQDDLTIEDPKAYARPLTGTLMFQLRPKWNIMDLVCEDNVNFEEFLKNEAKPPKK